MWLKSTRHAGLCRPALSTAHFYVFVVAEVMSNYLTTDGLKIFSLLPEAPWGLRPVAFATSATWLIRHCLHMARLMPLPLTVTCSSKIQTGFTFLVLAHPGSSGKRAIKRARVYIPSSNFVPLYNLSCCCTVKKLLNHSFTHQACVCQ